MTKTRTIQLAELKLLKSLCSFLDARNLRYYLAFGTLLGAVRHRGFIPWDDDVDIVMPREDYNKLLSFPDSAFEPPFRLSELRRSAEHVEFLGKYLDISKPISLYKEDRMAIVDKYIWIDIVPLDGLPKSKIKRLAIKYVSICLRLIYKLSVSNYNYKRSAIKNIIIKWMSRHIPRQKVYGLFLKLITKYSFYESETVVSANDLNTSFYIYPQNIFGNPVKIFFENGLYNAPENYKKFLEIQYGDYMKLPPDEERDHHGFYLN